MNPVTREEISSLWPFALNNALTIFYYRATAVFIEQFGNSAELANFRVTFVVMISALYIPKALIWASTPRIALHHEERDMEKFRHVLQQSADVNLYISAFVALGGLLYGARLIGVAFGHKYDNLGWLWYVVDVAMGLFFVQQFCADLLSNLHKERHVFRTLLLGIVVLTILNLVLIPRLGALGAAWARVAAGVVMVPLNLGTLAKLVGSENLHSFSLWRFLCVNVAAAVLGLAVMPVNFWLSIAVYVISYGAISYALRAMPAQFMKLTESSLRRVGLAAR
jgi:O-antigen/teichoic acid export membrane protein